MRRLFIVLALQLVCLVTSAQKVYYDGGYFEKDGSTWYEYKPQERSGVWNKFTEKTTDDNWYVIDNGLCHVAVPKSMNLDFLIRFPGETDWKFKYKHIAAPVATQKFSGKVVDLEGEPLAGASIMKKGTGIGAISDLDGNFVIAVEPSAVLEVSFIGYATKTVTAKDDMVVVMKEERTNPTGVDFFNEVLSQKKKIEQMTLTAIQANGNPYQATDVNIFYYPDTKQMCFVLDVNKPEIIDFYGWWSGLVTNIKGIARNSSGIENFNQQLRSTDCGMFFGIRKSTTKDYVKTKSLKADEIIKFY